jgi:hypothetical protein
LIEGNQVSQADPFGREFRLVVLAVSGFDNTIENNSFGGGAGQIGNEMTYSVITGQFTGINDPEVIVPESTYGVLFEGRPGAISADGRLIELPDLRAAALPGLSGPGMVVSILAGVNRDGTTNLSLAGQWFQVAQQVSLTSTGTIELLMENPLPPMPQRGYYLVEVTGGFVNNAYLDNAIDLTGKSSTGIVLDGEDYGTTIAGNHFIGGTTYDNVYTGAAILLGSGISSAANGGGPFPIPAGWTALPDLGAVIDGNTIRDSLGGILIGVEHSVNYWEALVTSTSVTGRVFVAATVSNNAFEFDSNFLSSWAESYVALGNDPAQSSTPPTITVGAGFSAEAPGPYGSPRFPWTAGNAIMVNRNDTPIFVDPVENMVSVTGNSAETIGANSTATPLAGTSGQVYDGIINGAVAATALTPMTFHNQPYDPFNLNNLNITVGTAPTPSPTGPGSPTPTPTPTPTPAPTPTPSPLPVPAAPLNTAVTLVRLNQVSLSWTASAGASGYTVERSTSGAPWSPIATAVTGLSYIDSNLAYSMTYDYRVVADSPAGDSAPSSVVSVQTLSQPDMLTGHSLEITLSKGSTFDGPVAIFSDAQAATIAGRFIATIDWGDGESSPGTVSGSDGSFTVIGAHAYSNPGVYSVQVTVSMSVPDLASVRIGSTAEVAAPEKHPRVPHARATHHVVRKTKRPAARHKPPADRHRR